MKKIKYILVFAFAFSILTVNAQEKKIKFSKGTLKICSSKNFEIKGYYQGSQAVGGKEATAV